MKTCLLHLSLGVMLTSTAAWAQPPAAPPAAPPTGFGPGTNRIGRPPSVPQGREDALDPSPVNPATDPNVDMFINDWRNSKPRTLYGKLVYQDLLTRQPDGEDPIRPTKRGAVLKEFKAFTHASLAPGAAASGSMPGDERQSFYTLGGTGTISVDGKSYDLREGSMFTLRPANAFRMTATGKAPLTFYIRVDDKLPDRAPNEAFTVTNRFDSDRRVGIHWVHIGAGGIQTLAPHTIPHPHSHHNEEIWTMLKGETILMIGKNLRHMTPGQSIRVPPTGLTAHSNINLSDEPVEMMVSIANGGGSEYDYAQLDDEAPDLQNGPDTDMFMGNWKDSIPRIVHGNLYFRDMLTGLRGADAQHPSRKGAVLVNAEAVSYAQLEPGSTAHRIAGQLKGIQQVFVVNSGVGTITAGGKEVVLKKGMSFIITPDLDFQLKGGGDKYMSFYVISEKLDPNAAPVRTLRVVDNSAAPTVASAWNDKERVLIRKEDGLAQYKSVASDDLGPMMVSRPYSIPYGGEEIWIATDGVVELLINKHLRDLPAGTAYAVPATGITAQGRLNVSSAGASFLHFTK